MSSNNESSLSSLPAEVLQDISHFLTDDDIFALSLASPSLDAALMSSKRSLNFSRCYSLRPVHLESYLNTHSSFLSLVEIDFTNCYWLPLPLIIRFIKSTDSLEKLSISGTGLTAVEISQILLHCTKLQHLNLSINGKDETFWKSVAPSIDDDDDLITRLSNFIENQQVFANLVSLKLHGDCYSYVQLAVIISLCFSLEELDIVISGTDQPTFSESIEMGSLIRRIPNISTCCRTLRSFSCFINDTTKGGPFFNLVKCVRAWRSPLESFWVPDFPLYHLRTLESPESSLIALQGSDPFFFHVCNYGKIRYLSVDCSMRHLVERFPDLEVVSCVFETEEIFYQFCLTHPKIKNLGLKFNKDISQGTFLGTGFQFLQNLRKFEIDSCLLQDRSIDQGIDIVHPQAVEELAIHCSFLEELEFLQKKYRLHITEETLQKFAKLKMLRVDGNLVLPKQDSELFGNLKVCRLGSVPAAFRSVPENPQIFLPSLRDLRLEYNEHSEVLEVLETMKYCLSLQRLALLKSAGKSTVETTDQLTTKLHESLLNLIENSKNLVFVFAQFTEQIDIAEVIEKFASRRPALSVQVGPRYSGFVPQAHIQEVVEISCSLNQKPF